MNQTLRAAICCGMLAIVALPMTAAHRAATLAANPLNLLLDGQESTGIADRGCRYTPNTGCFAHAGVSGNYVGAADGVFVVPGSLDIRAGSLSPSPGGVIYNPEHICDFEVMSDASGPGSPLDEADVDGAPGGTAPDATWDDGGYGAACHGTTYPWPAFNTAGDCTGVAHAEDTVLGADVWIGVACDYFDASLGTCGVDGIDDSVNFGRGGGDFPGPGVPYPPVAPAACAPFAMVKVYVLNYVDVSVVSGASATYNANLLPGIGNPAVAPGSANPGAIVVTPVSGWIDWSAAGPAAAWAPAPNPVTVIMPQCSDVSDNDGDGHLDYPGELEDDLVDDFILGDTDGDGPSSCAHPLDNTE
jgi:hypothetical protein